MFWPFLTRLFQENTTTMTSFSDRYAENWSESSARTLASTNNVCCLCKGKANQAHHIVYKDWTERPNAGKEVPGSNIFLLYSRCHEIASLTDEHRWILQSLGAPCQKHYLLTQQTRGM